MAPEGRWPDVQLAVAWHRGLSGGFRVGAEILGSRFCGFGAYGLGVLNLCGEASAVFEGFGMASSMLAAPSSTACKARGLETAGFGQGSWA